MLSGYEQDDYFSRNFIMIVVPSERRGQTPVGGLSAHHKLNA